MLRKSLTVSCVALLAALPLALAACGGDDDDDSSAAAGSTSSTSATEQTNSSGGGGETVKISETEFKLEPSDPTVNAGTVTFDATNDGTTTHNLEIEGNGVEDVTDDLQPGDSGQLTVDLKPGSYEIYCAIPGHREQGMEGEVTVQ